MWLVKRLAALFRRDEFESNLDDELKFHVEMKAKEFVESGMAPEAARQAALRQIGNLTHAKEETRGAWTFPRLETFAQDLRYGVRQLRRNPGFTAVAVVTLALGIGANTTIFSFISAWLMLKPPVHDPDRVTELVSRNPHPVWAADISRVSVPDFLDWRAQTSSYSDLAASVNGEFTLSGGAAPERASGLRVTANYFRVMGVEPLLGRTFAKGDDQPGHDRVVILGEGLWRREFAADPAIVGRTSRINTEVYTVIGVMPERYRIWAYGEQLWTPLVLSSEQTSAAARIDRSLNVIGRLRPGVQEAQARAELSTVAARLAQIHPDTNQGWGANVLTLQEYMIQEGNVRTALVFLMGTVGFVLLIACANLANLLLARSSARQREFTVRSALGAGRMRLVRQLLSECMLLAVGGGTLGLGLAKLGLQVLRAQINWSDYASGIASSLSIDARVLLFTLAASIGAALIFGLAPALRISRPDLNSGLQESSRSVTGSRERHRLQSLMVIGELALSLILLVGAGLFVRSFINEVHAPLGIDPRNTLTATVPLAGEAYKDSARQTAFFEAVLDRLRSYPEVRQAAVTSDLPYSFGASERFTIEGQPEVKPDAQPTTTYYAVGPGYFGVVGIPVQGGREFAPSDNQDAAPVAIINQALAEKFFPNQDPLGRHIRISRGDPAASQWREIVGVVGNVKEFTGQPAPRPQLFAPFLQRPQQAMSLVVRVSGDPAAFAPSLRQAVWGVDRDQAVTSLRTMDGVIRDSRQGDDLMAELMGVFAGIALIMAAIGIYGLLAYLVGQRTHEFGIRMALGARRSAVLKMVIGKAMRLAGVGVGVGFVLSLGLPVLFAASFAGFNVSSTAILLGTPVVVLVIAFVSCVIPARRATKVDPMEALRCE